MKTIAQEDVGLEAEQALRAVRKGAPRLSHRRQIFLEAFQSWRPARFHPLETRAASAVFMRLFLTPLTLLRDSDR